MSDDPQLPLGGFDLIEQILAERRTGGGTSATMDLVIGSPRAALRALAEEGPGGLRADAAKAARGFQRAGELIELIATPGPGGSTRA